MTFHVRGVHQIDAEEPVYLIDIAIDGTYGDVEWDAITQPSPAEPRENWQSVYDEQELPRLPDGRARAVFFFHYLDRSRPLSTGFGEVPLPAPTPIPADLRSIEYEEP